MLANRTIRESKMTIESKPWLDRNDYPFKSNYFDLPDWTVLNQEFQFFRQSNY